MKRHKLYNGVFDPTNASEKELNTLADAIEEYLNMFEEVMIFPETISKRDKEDINEAIMRSRKLIKKLRKGDRSVFNDEDQWNSLE